MRTTGDELSTEAAIYAEGTNYHGRDLARWYNEYADSSDQKGEEVDDFQRWAEANGYGN